jgi:hypothetical protein
MKIRDKVAIITVAAVQGQCRRVAYLKEGAKVVLPRSGLERNDFMQRPNLPVTPAPAF